MIIIAVLTVFELILIYVLAQDMSGSTAAGFCGSAECGLMMRHTNASVSRTDSDFLATRPATSICWRRELRPSNARA